MTYKEVVPKNLHPSNTQRDILYALGDNLYATQRVADRHESIGKAQIVTPKELQGKINEYFGYQPKNLVDYPKDDTKNYRIFSATAEGVEAADRYINSTLPQRRASDAQWLVDTASLLDKVHEQKLPYYQYNTVKACALQAAQNEVSEETKAETQHYLHAKNGKAVAAKAAEKRAAAEKAQEGPEIE